MVSPESVPAPYEAFSDSPNLVDTERQDLAACEKAIDGLRLAFWAAGKALQTIRDARLYRAKHATFEDYVEQRWQMSRAQAYRLIDAWPLAEVLSPMGDTLNERQVRALLPFAHQHGKDAAVTVYGTVASVEGVPLTATVLADVVQQIRDKFDPATAADEIRAYLARGDQDQEDAEPVDPATAWTAEAERLRNVVRRAVTRPSFQAAARARPAEARAVVAELRALLDEVEAATAGEGDEEPPAA
ncbi:hypothetical protein ACLQ2P_41660 [Actinomadura citrea]|uniref:hypothetical protein n=1 Tax=Actinomadura citrea TaxID=46158 RepID=UPI003CE572A0